jgi:cysteine-rich repeat protein
MKCLPICGDGIILSAYEKCDDANKIDKDGCSSACTVEKDFICDSEPSVCTLHLIINSFTFNYAYRVLGQNKGILSFIIEPKN